MRFRGGEFSTGTMGNFQPELTTVTLHLPAGAHEFYPNGRPTGVKVRSPLAWVASAEDNNADEADRQSHLKGW
jgi:hypothetical protein